MFLEGATREHFIVAKSSSVTYVEARWVGDRPHLTVPYPKPDEPPFIPLQFKCFSSCPGGIGRRSVYVDFSLENKYVSLSFVICSAFN